MQVEAIIEEHIPGKFTEVCLELVRRANSDGIPRKYNLEGTMITAKPHGYKEPKPVGVKPREFKSGLMRMTHKVETIWLLREIAKIQHRFLADTDGKYIYGKTTLLVESFRPYARQWYARWLWKNRYHRLRVEYMRCRTLLVGSIVPLPESETTYLMARKGKLYSRIRYLSQKLGLPMGLDM